MPKDKSTGKKLADMMYGNPEGAAFGITPMIGKRREDRQDREAAKSFPVDLARGVVAGAVGLPGDIESLARLPYELITGNESPTFLPTSEDVLKRIPFGTNTPAGQFASGLGTLAGGSANLGALPRAVKAAPGALKTAARNISEPRTLNPQAGVIKMKGGNWLGGNLMGNIDRSVRGLRPYPDAEKTLEGAQASLARHEGDPFMKHAVEPQRRVVDDYKKKVALNNWVESNLGKYVKNQMATPEDPIRLLLDKRTKEIEAKHAKDMERAERMAQRAIDEPDPRRQANMIRESDRLKMEANVERQFAMDSIIPSRMQDYSPDADYYLKQRRQDAGFPAEGMGESEAAKRYETLTDDAISTMRAGDVQETKNILAQAQDAERAFKTKQLEVAKRFDGHLRASGLNENEIRVLNEKTPITEKADIIQDREYGELGYAYNKLRTDIRRDEFAAGQENPFIDKLDPETQLYSGNTADMGFDHVIDILKQDVEAGRIRPEQLNRVSVEDAVRRTMEFDQEAAKKMAEAQIKNMEGFPVYKEYPEGYRWVELKKPEDLPEGYSLDDMGNVVDEKGHITNHPGEKRLEEALKYEGDTMGHCVGGYCPDVLEGKSRIFSLRDARGEPHVTVEVGPVQGRTSYDDMQAIYNQAQEEANASNFATTGEFNNFYNDRVKELQFALIDKQKAELPERIVQIKGKQNAAPKAEYLPYVQDFVKSGTYSEVGDLENTGLRRTSDAFNETEQAFLRSKGVELKPYIEPEETARYQEMFKRTPDVPPEGMARGGRVHISDNPDVMQLELAGGGLVKGLKAAAKAVKPAEAPMKASEALGRIEGRPLVITQADRTKVGGGFLGGPGFSGLQLEDPAYRAAEAAWAVKNPGTAKMILGGRGDSKDAVYAAMLGTPTQHQSNQMVFDKLLGDFKKAAKKGGLDSELRDRINMRLANSVDKDGNNIFPPDVDILDKNFKDLASTFDRRSVTANLIGGMGVGGKKGQIIDYDKIIRQTTDPMLLESPTGALGNRLFTLSGGIIERPDLHPAFPTIMQGEDLGVSFDPVARNLIMKDFTEKTMREKGRAPGIFDYTRGYPPSQLITEDILTELQKMGKKAGGAVKVEQKVQVPMSSQKKSEQRVQNPVHFTESPDVMRLALTQRN